MNEIINDNEIILKVMEARQDDIDKGIVRVDGQSMRDLNVKSGDVIEITGSRKTVAIVARSYPADVGLSIVRMDGLTRRNAKTSIGETVKIKIINAKMAKKVVIAPAQKGVQVQIVGQPIAIKKALLGRPLTKGDIITLGGTNTRRRTFSGSPFEEIFRMFEGDPFMGVPFHFAGVKFLVTNTSEKSAVMVTDKTEIVLNPEATDIKEDTIPEVSYEDIGGLEDELRKVREIVETPIKHPEIFQRLGIDAPKGVLLFGPPGTGKTLLAKAVATEANAHFISINGPEVMSKWVGEAEKKIRKVFQEAEENSPAIIFIDEIDSIAPKREEVNGEVERRVVAQILGLMDGLKARGKVIVIAATNRENSIDPALRRPGRFDREIEIGVPDKKARHIIFKIHTRNMPLDKDVKIENYSNITHGFVGADIEAVCKEAAMVGLRKFLPEIKKYENQEGGIPDELLEKIIIKNDDFNQALKQVSPSAMREVMIEIPTVKYEDIGGLNKVIDELQESVEWPIKHPEGFKRLGIKPPKGILLYGPPGTGKTLLAKAVANESEANFITVKGPELISKWVGESEKAIRAIFKKARQVSPSVIFFDEIDSIAGKRVGSETSRVEEKVVNQLLTEIDGMQGLNDVTVIAATNRPDIIDDALLRPGRFDKLIMVPAPDIEARKKIFEVHLRNVPTKKSVDLKKLSKNTEGFSGADIQGVVREAAMNTLRKNKDAVNVPLEELDKAVKESKSSISYDVVDFYEKFTERLKNHAVKEGQNYLG